MRSPNVTKIKPFEVDGIVYEYTVVGLVYAQTPDDAEKGYATLMGAKEKNPELGDPIVNMLEAHAQSGKVGILIQSIPPTEEECSEARASDAPRQDQSLPMKILIQQPKDAVFESDQLLQESTAYLSYVLTGNVVPFPSQAQRMANIVELWVNEASFVKFFHVIGLGQLSQAQDLLYRDFSEQFKTLSKAAEKIENSQDSPQQKREAITNLYLKKAADVFAICISTELRKPGAIQEAHPKLAEAWRFIFKQHEQHIRAQEITAQHTFQQGENVTSSLPFVISEPEHSGRWYTFDVRPLENLEWYEKLYCLPEIRKARTISQTAQSILPNEAPDTFLGDTDFNDLLQRQLNLLKDSEKKVEPFLFNSTPSSKQFSNVKTLITLPIVGGKTFELFGNIFRYNYSFFVGQSPEAIQRTYNTLINLAKSNNTQAAGLAQLLLNQTERGRLVIAATDSNHINIQSLGKTVKAAGFHFNTGNADFMLIPAQKSTEELANLLSHEGSHHLAYRLSGDSNPFALNEGARKTLRSEMRKQRRFYLQKPADQVTPAEKIMFEAPMHSHYNPINQINAILQNPQYTSNPLKQGRAINNALLSWEAEIFAYNHQIGCTNIEALRQFNRGIHDLIQKLLSDFKLDVFRAQHSVQALSAQTGAQSAQPVFAEAVAATKPPTPSLQGRTQPVVSPAARSLLQTIESIFSSKAHKPSTLYPGDLARLAEDVQHLRANQPPICLQHQPSSVTTDTSTAATKNGYTPSHSEPQPMLADQNSATSKKVSRQPSGARGPTEPVCEVLPPKKHLPVATRRAPITLNCASPNSPIPGLIKKYGRPTVTLGIIMIGATLEFIEQRKQNPSLTLDQQINITIANVASGALAGQTLFCCLGASYALPIMLFASLPKLDTQEFHATLDEMENRIDWNTSSSSLQFYAILQAKSEEMLYKIVTEASRNIMQPLQKASHSLIGKPLHALLEANRQAANLSFASEVEDWNLLKKCIDDINTSRTHHEPLATENPPAAFSSDTGETSNQHHSEPEKSANSEQSERKPTSSSPQYPSRDQERKDKFDQDPIHNPPPKPSYNPTSDARSEPKSSTEQPAENTKTEGTSEKTEHTASSESKSTTNVPIRSKPRGLKRHQEQKPAFTTPKITLMPAHLGPGVGVTSEYRPRQNGGGMKVTAGFVLDEESISRSVTAWGNRYTGGYIYKDSCLEHNGETYHYTIKGKKSRLIVTSYNTKNPTVTRKSKGKLKNPRETVERAVNKVIQHEANIKNAEIARLQNEFNQTMAQDVPDLAKAKQLLDQLSPYHYLTDIAQFIRAGDFNIRLSRLTQEKPTYLYDERGSFNTALGFNIDAALRSSTRKNQKSPTLDFDLSNLDRTQKGRGDEKDPAGYIINDVNYINKIFDSLRRDMNPDLLFVLLDDMKKKKALWSNKISKDSRGNGPENLKKLEERIKLLEKHIHNYQYQKRVTAIPNAQAVFHSTAEANLQPTFIQLLEALACANPAEPKQRELALYHVMIYLEDTQDLDPKQIISMFQTLSQLFTGPGNADIQSICDTFLNGYNTSISDLKEHLCALNATINEFNTSNDKTLAHLNTNEYPWKKWPGTAIRLRDEFIRDQQKKLDSLKEQKKALETMPSDKTAPSEADIVKLQQVNEAIEKLELLIPTYQGNTISFIETWEEFLIFCLEKLMGSLLEVTEPKYQEHKPWLLLKSLYQIEPKLVPALIQLVINTGDKRAITVILNILLKEWRALLIKPQEFLEWAKLVNELLMTLANMNTAAGNFINPENTNLASKIHYFLRIIEKYRSIVSLMHYAYATALHYSPTLGNAVTGVISNREGQIFLLWSTYNKQLLTSDNFGWQTALTQLGPSLLEIPEYCYETLVGQRPENKNWYTTKNQLVPMATAVASVVLYFKTTQTTDAAQKRSRTMINTIKQLLPVVYGGAKLFNSAYNTSQIQAAEAMFSNASTYYRQGEKEKALGKLVQIKKLLENLPWGLSECHQLKKKIIALEYRIFANIFFEQKQHQKLFHLTREWEAKNHRPSAQERAWVLIATRELYADSRLNQGEKTRAISLLKKFCQIEEDNNNYDARVIRIVSALTEAAHRKIEVSETLFELLIAHASQEKFNLKAIVILAQVNCHRGLLDGYLPQAEILTILAEAGDNAEDIAAWLVHLYQHSSFVYIGNLVNRYKKALLNYQNYFAKTEDELKKHTFQGKPITDNFNFVELVMEFPYKMQDIIENLKDKKDLFDSYSLGRKYKKSHCFDTLNITMGEKLNEARAECRKLGDQLGQQEKIKTNIQKLHAELFLLAQKHHRSLTADQRHNITLYYLNPMQDLLDLSNQRRAHFLSENTSATFSGSNRSRNTDDTDSHDASTLPGNNAASRCSQTN